MGWCCVHIAHTRVARAVNVTFRNMLIDEYRILGEPKDCHVYRRVRPDDSCSYFFSPAAAGAMEAFVNFWEGYECDEPTNLAQMDILI
jgi:hypothetical protein